MEIAADGLGIDEVHRSAGHRLGVAERNLGLVRRQVLGSEQLEFVIFDRAFVVQVEIDVVGHVEDRRGIRFGRKGQTEGVVIIPLVTGDNLQVARITGFSVLGEIHEFDRFSIDPAFPDLGMEALRATVQGVLSVVDREFIRLAVEGETAACDAVGETARAFSGASTVAEIARRVVKAIDDIVQFPILVRDDDADDGRTDAGQFNIGAGGIGQTIFQDFFSVRGRAPNFFLDIHGMLVW